MLVVEGVAATVRGRCPQACRHLYRLLRALEARVNPHFPLAGPDRVFWQGRVRHFC